MNKITFVIPSRNNLEFLQLAYKSIRNLKTTHDILVLNDASTDGTNEWLEQLNDPDVIIHHNTGPDRIGIVGMFDKGIEMARTEIIFAYHADMIAGPNLDVNILKHLKSKTVVSATRIEPPLHPSGPEKITQDWGNEVEDIDFNDIINSINHLERENKEKITEGIFAPWCMYKEDFLAIGGHDELFAPQSKEDSDLFNRMHLAGYKFIQPWDALVYHFTSRGSRFNKHAGGAAGQNSQEWIHTTTKNGREFIRKWGHFIKHDQFMKPIIPPKYDVGFIVNNVHKQLIEVLEPWCSTMYTDDSYIPIGDYIEQQETAYDLNSKFMPYGNEKQNGVLVEIDGNSFNQQDFQYIHQLSEIIADSGEIGEFALGNLKITITNLETLDQNIIVCKS